MIETRVRVISNSGGLSFVQATEHNGCGACASKESCGISGLGKLFSNRRQPLALDCASARTGDELVVGVEEGDLLAAGVWAYVLPTLLAVAGASVATLYGLGDAPAVISAAAGVALGLLLARFLARAPQLHVRQSEPSPTTGETP